MASITPTSGLGKFPFGKDFSVQCFLVPNFATPFGGIGGINPLATGGIGGISPLALGGIGGVGGISPLAKLGVGGINPLTAIGAGIGGRLF